MPTYEYQCEACSHEFEVFQKMSDEPVSVCPECGGPVRRILGPGGGFILKGSGFYATDYRADASRPRCGRDNPCCGREAPCNKPPCE